jgi:hypothetical protein
MTQEEFNNTRFSAKMKAKYKDGNEYLITDVDFDEQLIGLDMNILGCNEGDVSWVRCENCTIIS